MFNTVNECSRIKANDNNKQPPNSQPILSSNGKLINVLLFTLSHGITISIFPPLLCRCAFDNAEKESLIKCHIRTQVSVLTDEALVLYNSQRCHSFSVCHSVYLLYDIKVILKIELFFPLSETQWHFVCTPFNYLVDGENCIIYAVFLANTEWGARTRDVRYQFSIHEFTFNYNYQCLDNFFLCSSGDADDDDDSRSRYNLISFIYVLALIRIFICSNNSDTNKYALKNQPTKKKRCRSLAYMNVWHSCSLEIEYVR